MPSFQDRLNQAATLENPFIERFNSVCETHRIVKFGFESTQLGQIHQYIRSADDPTAHFVRYLPDSALVRTFGSQTSTTPQITLVEFKRQQQLVRTEYLFNIIKAAHGSGRPPLSEKRDIFDMELDALRLYQSIQERLGVGIVIVALQAPRLPDAGALRAQFATDVVVCQEHTPSSGGGGSGTRIANTHFDSLQPAAEFFFAEFGIDESVLSEVLTALRESERA